MKKVIYLIFTAVIIIGLNACEKDKTSLVTKSETISMGAGYVNDIYYRLSDGLTTTVARANWDIAFSVSTREAAILANNSSGVTLKAFPTTPNWTWASAIDTAGYSTWASLTNSDTTWAEGAFNMNATVHPNYGWGVYNEVTHNLTGAALYLVKTRNGAVKKIFIDNKISVDQKYTFKYADLNGSNEKVVTLTRAGKKKNFMYYSLDTNAEVDREPETDKWDIVFTKYIDKTINYTVTGVLQNVGVTAQESTDVDPLSEVMPTSGFLTAISVIGSDWKSFSMDTFQYTVDDTRVFFVKDQNDMVHRIKFTAFEGSQTGNLSFDVSTIK